MHLHKKYLDFVGLTEYGILTTTNILETQHDIFDHREHVFTIRLPTQPGRNVVERFWERCGGDGIFLDERRGLEECRPLRRGHGSPDRLEPRLLDFGSI